MTSVTLTIGGSASTTEIRLTLCEATSHAPKTGLGLWGICAYQEKFSHKQPG